MRKKRKQKSGASTMSLRDSHASGGSNGAASPRPVGVPSEQVRPGVVLVDGCEAAITNAQITSAMDACTFLPAQAGPFSVGSGSEENRQERDFNDFIPDEILSYIFKYCWRPDDCWQSAMVCKRWCVLRACSQLRKQSVNRISGHVPCIATLRTPEGRRRSSELCIGSSRALKLKEIESEWYLAMTFLTSCKRHTHAMEIKDCTHISERGYNLMSEFACNLRALRLDSCVSMDDSSLGLILDRCSNLRSVHLSCVPKLRLESVEKKVPRLHELRVYGCNLVTPARVFSILRNCLQLKVLCLSAMEGSSAVAPVVPDVPGSPRASNQASSSKLQMLELSNSHAVTPEILPIVGVMLPNLRTVNLSDCPGLSDDAFKVLIASRGSHLQRLVVTRCSRLSDESVRSLASVATELQDLCLAGTSVGDDGLRALMESTTVISKLRILSLAKCPKLTDEGLKHFISARPRLLCFKSLDVQNCPGVSATMLAVLEQDAAKDGRKKWSLVRDWVTVPRNAEAVDNVSSGLESPASHEEN